jgi:lipopolysaccharide export system protein LptA
VIGRGAWAAAVLLAAFASAPAWAQPIDLSSGGPIEVTSRDGFEWNENAQTVTANTDARAVRGDVTVLADQLIAHYRKKNAPAQPQPAAATPGDTDTGSNEIYRLDAVGHVRIVTPTDEAMGDKAVYDIDQSVLVMTGHNLRLTTPQYVMTARDSMEYWSQQHMAVGRGNAVVVATDGRRLSGDVLVGYTTPATPAPATSATPAPGAAAAKPTGSDINSSGKLQRVEAFGNVEVRTQTDDVRGDRGVYLPDGSLARVVGNVRIVHGQNVITGPAADLNMNTGIAHVLSTPANRVEGLIMPNSAQSPPGSSAAAPKGPSR